LNKGTEVFKRYLTVFHGTLDAREFSYSYSPDSAVYLAFDSADMRKTWGCADDYAEAALGTASEWQAYIDGDVYGIAVERRVTISSTTTFQGESVPMPDVESWEEVDDSACWGYYGETYATEAAIELLEDYDNEA
jgi:hypothetical protein